MTPLVIHTYMHSHIQHTTLSSSHWTVDHFQSLVACPIASLVSCLVCACVCVCACYVEEMVYDSSRQLLFTLSSASAVTCYSLGATGMEMHFKAHNRAIWAEAKQALRFVHPALCEGRNDTPRDAWGV